MRIYNYKLAKDKIDNKPGIHEDIYLMMKVKESQVKFAWSHDVDTNPKSDRGWIDADWIYIRQM